MNYLQRLEYWGEAHHPKYLDIIRIALGVFLCFKGIEFASDSSLLSESIEDRFLFSSFLMVIVVHYIIFAHIVGGFLIAVGLLTRLACGVQIPILIGALIFVSWNAMQHFSEFFLSLITLLLLCFFLIIGSGPWSLDRFMWTEEDKTKTNQ